MTSPASPPVDILIEARVRELGGLKIRRLLPSRPCRMVGPFIFLDHIGPESLEPGRGIDVPPHPHIGLATVTYLFEGDLVHRDSLGCVETIRPGEINWMHAGRGIVHSERSGPEQRKKESGIHGLQVWVALPGESEETPPQFHHYPEESLPTWAAGGTRARVLIGEALGLASPVVTASPTLYLDVSLEAGASLRIPEARERAVYVVEGRVSVGGAQEVPEGTLAVLGRRTDIVMTSAHHSSRAVVLGGSPIRGERHIWWNFVSSSRERIDQARRDWAEGRFPPVPGDDERVDSP